MKEGIHPQYYPEALVTCVCGASWHTGSTNKELRVDICSSCHPFFTGKQKLMDTEGRIDRFRKKYAGNATVSAAVSAAVSASGSAAATAAKPK